MFKIRFSKAVKKKYSDVEREKLAGEFVERFRQTGKRFAEKHVGADVLICNVTQKLFQIMFESEW